MRPAAPGGLKASDQQQLRGLLERSLLALLVVVSVMLLLLSKADIRLVGYVSERVREGAVPVLAALGEPLLAARRVIDRMGALLAVYEENAKLREENRRLLAWQAEAGKLAVQNRALRQMLKVPTVDAAPVWTTARVVADAAGGFVRSVVVDAGNRDGVTVGMPALTPAGLAGRVIDVGCCSARVLLVTDFGSRIPVVLERSGEQGLLAGDTTPSPLLQFLPQNADVRVGDRVLTSGNGGLIPLGLMVGRVTGVAPGAGAEGPTARIETFVDWGRLDYLSLLRYAGVPPP